MYVCICHAVTDRDVQAAVDKGVCSMAGLCRSLKVGTKCGRCSAFAQETLKKSVAKTPVLQGQTC